jgi:hypothetical protein
VTVSQGMSFILFTGPDCLSRTAREYNDWVTLGKPKCWCYRKQCRGDADGLLLGPLPVSLNDLNILRTYLNLPEAMVAQCDQAPVITGPYNFWASP